MKCAKLIVVTVLALLAVQAPVLAEKPNPLLLGEYELDRNNGVVDGDTIRCWKLDGGVRILGVDAEETFKSLDDRRTAGLDYDAYRAAKLAVNDLPVKFGSFLGEEGAHFARDFFQGVKSVRLEYDSAARKKDIYGRHLCYVFATPKNAKAEQNFSVELVRAGYSPYSAKYGHSLRFRKEFEAAQKEAREGGRGIWNPKAMGYRDYDKRLEWWNARAEQLEKLTRSFTGDTDIDLAADAATEALGKAAGKSVRLLCSMAEMKDAFVQDEKTAHMWCTVSPQCRVKVIFAEGMFEACKVLELRGWYVLARGTLTADGRNYTLTITRAEDFKKA
jgi:endonuclease YncB( thermonuclease family)